MCFPSLPIWRAFTCTQVLEEEILTATAVDLLAEHLATPLQIAQYLTRALKDAYQVAKSPPWWR
jgi:hypothetical protein